MIFAVAFRYTGIALQFAILLILARTLSPRDYGSYLFVLSAVLPTYFLLGLGASESFVREAPRRRVSGDREAVAKMAGGVVLLTGGSAFVIGGASAVAIFVLVPDSQRALYWFMLVFFISNGVMFNGAQLLLGLGAEKMGAFFFYPALNVVLLISSVPYVTWVTRPTFEGVAIVTSVAAALASLIAVVAVFSRVRLGWAPRSVLRILVADGLKLSAARLLYSVGLWLPTFLAGIFLSSTQAGYLGTAGRLAVAVAAVGAAFRFAVRPAIVRAFAGNDLLEIRRVCAQLASVTFGLAALALLASYLFGESLVAFAFGSDFKPVAPLLSILLIGVAAESFGGPIDEVLKMTGHENKVLLLFAIAIPLLSLSLVVSSGEGAKAMAVSQVLYVSVLFGAMTLAVRKLLGIWVYPSFIDSIFPRLKRVRNPIESEHGL
jgi:O-antigen/teichoic acid export membrane protein